MPNLGTLTCETSLSPAGLRPGCYGCSLLRGETKYENRPHQPVTTIDYFSVVRVT